MPQAYPEPKRFSTDGLGLHQRVEATCAGGARPWLKNWVLPALGAVRIRDLTTEEIQALIRSAEQAGKTPQTCKHILGAVKAILKHARRSRFWSGDDPTEFVVLPQVWTSERPAPSPEQVKAVMAEWPDGRVLILLLCVTGLRIGEGCGLRWKRINFSEQDLVLTKDEVVPALSLRISETWKYYKGGWRYQTPKSLGSRRPVDLQDGLLEELAAWKAASRFKGPDDPVFAGRTGRPWDYQNYLRRKLKPAAEKLDMPWLSWHSFRHAVDSWGERVGMSLSERQAFMGHSDLTMTQKYSHAQRNKVRAGLDRVADLVIEKGRVM